MKRRSQSLARLTAACSVLVANPAGAVALGEVVSQSAVGEPLRVEIRLASGNGDQVAKCLRLIRPAAASADDIPYVQGGRIGTRVVAGETRVIVTSPSPALSPILRLRLEETCESGLQRDFTLLLSEPAHLQAPLASASAGEPLPAVRSPILRPSRRGYVSRTAAEGESVASIAAERYPDDASSQQRFTALTLNANRGRLPPGASETTEIEAGTQLLLPKDSLIQNANAAPAASAAQVKPQVRPRVNHNPDRTLAARPSRQSDRLVISGEEQAPEELKLAPTLSSPTGVGRPAAEANDHPPQEERLRQEVDGKTDAQAALIARIRDLEAMEAHLRDEVQRLGVEAHSGHDVLALPTTEPKRPQAFDWRSMLAGALAMSVLMLAAMLIRWQRERSETLKSATVPRESSPATLEAAGARPEALHQPSQASTPTRHAPDADWEALLPSADSAIAPLSATDITAEEHESAIELAEIMMSFGRVHGAAETLAEFIRSNPKQAVTPWLKLLEVYRAAGMQGEFESLAHKLNKTFNVKVISWEGRAEPADRTGSLEQMPHIAATVQRLWGTRECQAYLSNLLNDNRNGTREGFPLPVVEEILLLAAVLEQELGPYRGESSQAA